LCNPLAAGLRAVRFHAAKPGVERAAGQAQGHAHSIFARCLRLDAPWEGKPRWEVAKRLLAKMADSLNAYPNLELRLRVYGHQRLLLT